MAVYVIMEPPAASPGSDPLFVRDGFHVLAFLLPLVWFLWHGLWIEALVALAVTLALSALGTFGGLADAVSAIGLLAALFFGLEAANLRIAALGRRGWRESGVVEARRMADAEARQAVHMPDDEPNPPPRRMTVPETGMPGNAPALGLLDYPGPR